MPSQLEGYELELSSTNTSGYKNVHRSGKRWSVSISDIYLGVFDTPQQAALAVAKHRAGAMTVEEEQEQEGGRVAVQADARVDRAEGGGCVVRLTLRVGTAMAVEKEHEEEEERGERPTEVRTAS